MFISVRINAGVKKYRILNKQLFPRIFSSSMGQKFLENLYVEICPSDFHDCRFYYVSLANALKLKRTYTICGVRGSI